MEIGAKVRKNKGTAKANMKTRIPIMLLLNSDDDIIIQGMDWIIDTDASFHETPRLDFFTYHKFPRCTSPTYKPKVPISHLFSLN